MKRLIPAKAGCACRTHVYPLIPHVYLYSHSHPVSKRVYSRRAICTQPCAAGVMSGAVRCGARLGIPQGIKEEL